METTQSRTRGLRKGNPGNAGGRPSNAFRAKCLEFMEYWMDRSSKLLDTMEKEAKTFEQKAKLATRMIKMAELYGKFGGLEKMELSWESAPQIVIDFGGMSIEERQALLDKMEAEDEAKRAARNGPKGYAKAT